MAFDCRRERLNLASASPFTPPLIINAWNCIDSDAISGRMPSEGSPYVASGNSGITGVSEYTFLVVAPLRNTGIYGAQTLLTAGSGTGGNGNYVALRIVNSAGNAPAPVGRVYTSAYQDLVGADCQLGPYRIHAVLLAVSVGANTRQLWVDGSLSASATALTATTSNLSYVFIGCDSSAATSGRYNDGGICAAFGWNRCLSAAEAGAVTANPWQLFRRRSARMWTAPAAAPGGFVFNPLSGRGGSAAQPLVLH